MKTDEQLTDILQVELLRQGCSPLNYEWLNGEAWYYGEPIAGRATEREQKAVLATHRQQFDPHAPFPGSIGKH